MHPESIAEIFSPRSLRGDCTGVGSLVCDSRLLRIAIIVDMAAPLRGQAVVCLCGSSIGGVDMTIFVL